MYVAACKDLALRTFSVTFELTSTVRLTSTVLGYIIILANYVQLRGKNFGVLFQCSLAFNDSSGELYSGGIGTRF